MIDAELAVRATTLLSTAVVELFEEEDLDLISIPARGTELARAERLAALGRDVTALALALEVILRRSVEAAVEADA